MITNWKLWYWSNAFVDIAGMYYLIGKCGQDDAYRIYLDIM